MRYLLYIPAVFFFLLPLVYSLHQSSVARRAARAKEEKRRAVAAAKEAAEREKEAAKAARAASALCIEQAPRKRGRPRKHPAPEQCPEIILTAAPVSVVQPVAVPAALSPETFAESIR